MAHPATKQSWHGENIPSSVKRVIFRMRQKGCVLQKIAAAVGYSRETVRVVLKADGHFPARVPRPPRLCKIPGCNRKYFCRGYCSSHLGKLLRRTIDNKGKTISIARKCRICRGQFYVFARGHNRQMCDHCRPLGARKRSGSGRSAGRADEILRLRRCGRNASEIAEHLSLSVSAVSATLCQSQPPLEQGSISDGLCKRCGGKRNAFAKYCDGCHEIALVKQRERLRRKYKQVPRCNAIGCRFKPVSAGFCKDCREDFRSGRIDRKGKHRLTTCVCSCRFIPTRNNQQRCLNCA